MSIKASSFKNWCTENISPQSWTRICLKCIDEIRDKGLILKDFEDKPDTIEIDEELLGYLNNALNNLYEMTVDSDTLSQF